MLEKTKTRKKGGRKKEETEPATYSVEDTIKLFLLLGKRISWNIDFMDKSTSLIIGPTPKGVRPIRGISKEEQSPLGVIYLTRAIKAEADRALGILQKQWEEEEERHIDNEKHLAKLAVEKKDKAIEDGDKLRKFIDQITREYAENIKTVTESYEEIHREGYNDGYDKAEKKFSDQSYDNGFKCGIAEIGEDYLPTNKRSEIQRYIREYCEYSCSKNVKAPVLVPSFCGNCSVRRMWDIMDDWNKDVYWKELMEEYNITD